MNRIIRTTQLAIVISLGLVWLLSGSAFAADQSSFGGNNASDYQPPTGNPQSNTATGLQTPTVPLQPIPGLTQQNLLQAQDLKVSTAANGSANTTSIPPVSLPARKSSFPTMVVGGTLTLIAVLYVLFRPEKPAEGQQPIAAAANPATPKLDRVSPSSSADKPKPKPKNNKKKPSKKSKPTRK